MNYFTVLIGLLLWNSLVVSIP